MCSPRNVIMTKPAWWVHSSGSFISYTSLIPGRTPSVCRTAWVLSVWMFWTWSEYYLEEQSPQIKMELALGPFLVFDHTFMLWTFQSVSPQGCPFGWRCRECAGHQGKLMITIIFCNHHVIYIHILFIMLYKWPRTMYMHMCLTMWECVCKWR